MGRPYCIMILSPIHDTCKHHSLELVALMCNNLCGQKINVISIFGYWIFNIIFSFQAEKINTILKAAKVDVEPYWPGRIIIQFYVVLLYQFPINFNWSCVTFRSFCQMLGGSWHQTDDYQHRVRRWCCPCCARCWSCGCWKGWRYRFVYFIEESLLKVIYKNGGHLTRFAHCSP